MKLVSTETSANSQDLDLALFCLQHPVALSAAPTSCKKSLFAAFAGVHGQSREHHDPSKISNIRRFTVCVPAIDTGTQSDPQFFCPCWLSLAESRADRMGIAPGPMLGLALAC